MAMDSKAKRMSAFGFNRVYSLPVATDATLGAAWRASVAGGYAGLTYEAPSDDFIELFQTMQHTGTAAASQVVLMYGPIAFSAGDKLRIDGKFSTDDSGSSWLKDKTVISIYRVL